ncbi:MAG: CRISPR-associated protein Cas4 [bacterium]
MESEIYIIPSDVVEYSYCPRFIYFERVLMIPQHEENRYKVIVGRELHKERTEQNQEYLRKKLGVIDKQTNVWMASEQLHLKGEVDEVLFLDDGTAAPLDYKYAEWSGKIYQSNRIQSILYALLIQENFHKPVTRGFLIYVRSKNHLEILQFTEAAFEFAKETICDIITIIQRAKFPKRTKWTTRCADCCYKNICIK